MSAKDDSSTSTSTHPVPVWINNTQHAFMILVYLGAAFVLFMIGWSIYVNIADRMWWNDEQHNEKIEENKRNHRSLTNGNDNSGGGGKHWL